MTIFTASLLHSISKVENEDPEMFQTFSPYCLCTESDEP